MVDRNRLLDLFLALCRIDSPSRMEREVSAFVQRDIEGLGLQCIRDDAHRHTGGDCGNLVATLPGNVSDVEPIFFSAHFDTVAPNPGVKITVEDGIVRSDGTSILGADDKGGMAPILEAMRCIVQHGLPHGDIQLVFSVSEEIGLLGAHHLQRDLLTARHGFVLDTGPPVGSIVVGAPTQNMVDATIYGRPAHAGFEPEKGISAIEVAAEAIHSMKLGRIDQETTANIGVIHGGAATNIVCPLVTMRGEARSHDTTKLEAQVKHMTEALHSAAARHGATAEVAVSRAYDGYRLNDRSPGVAVALQAARNLGLPSGTRIAGGGSDANVYNARGIPACVLGTGMSKIHTHEEHIAIDDLVRSTEWVLEIARLTASSESAHRDSAHAG